MTRRWGLRVTVPVLAAVAVGVVAVVAGGEVNIGYLVGATVLVAVAMWTAMDLVPHVQYPNWNVTTTHTPRQPGTDMRLARFTERLTSGVDREAVANDVHRLLADVVNERLQRKYGIDRSTDPESANRVLGPELTAYLNGNPHLKRHAQADQISALLTRIEAL